MPLFITGNKKAVGRPKGSKDYTWAKVSTWIDRLNAVWKDLTPNQQAHYSVELAKLLTSKLKALPGDPEDSKLNASEAMLMLKQAESIDVKLSDVKTEGRG